MPRPKKPEPKAMMPMVPVPLEEDRDPFLEKHRKMALFAHYKGIAATQKVTVAALRRIYELLPNMAPKEVVATLKVILPMAQAAPKKTLDLNVKSEAAVPHGPTATRTKGNEALVAQTTVLLASMSEEEKAEVIAAFAPPVEDGEPN